MEVATVPVKLFALALLTSTSMPPNVSTVSATAAPICSSTARRRRTPARDRRHARCPLPPCESCRQASDEVRRSSLPPRRWHRRARRGARWPSRYRLALGDEDRLPLQCVFIRGHHPWKHAVGAGARSGRQEARRRSCRKISRRASTNAFANAWFGSATSLRLRRERPSIPGLSVSAPLRCPSSCVGALSP